MNKRKGTGIMIFVLCITGFFTYAYLLMISEWSPIVMQLSVLMIVGGVLGVISWIGYMMATTKKGPTSIITDDDEPIIKIKEMIDPNFPEPDPEADEKLSESK